MLKQGNLVLSFFCAGCVMVLEFIALSKGIDGTCLSLAIGALAGLGGFGIGKLWEKRRNKNE